MSTSSEFRKAFRTSPDFTEWLIWCGMPMLYDGGLCVNRTIEENNFSRFYKYTSFLEI